MSRFGSALSHAYILRLEGEADGSAPVRELVSEMLCDSEGARPCGVCRHCDKVRRGIHPDVFTITRLDNKKEILVEQVREAVNGALLLPNEAARRVILINGADTMNINAQNALLKLLEEPPRHIALVLVTASPGALLPTVRSRCRLIDLGGDSESAPEQIRELAARYFELALQGGAPLAELSFELEKTERPDFAPLLHEVREVASAYMRRALELGKTAADAMRIIELTRSADEYLRRNVSTIHISALLCTPKLD